MIFNKIKFMIVVSVFLLLLLPNISLASHLLDERDERKVAIVYDGTDDQTMANIHFLDSTLSGLFRDVTLIHLNELTRSSIEMMDIVAYYSVYDAEHRTHLSVIGEFDGFVLGIGDGARHLPQLNEWSILGKEKITQIDNLHLEFPIDVLHIDSPSHVEVLKYGKRYDQQYPIIVKDRSVGLINLNNIYNEVKYMISKEFYSLFNLSEPTDHPAYLRLEDISPAADPELVLEAGSYLLERGIPVYLAVIPVYLNPETGEQITINDTPKLKKVLLSLVNQGAYIISHGYTHAYRYTETGEGFEFWDSMLNQPITSLNMNEDVQEIKKQDEFANLQQYQKYYQDIQDVETEYTNDKLIRSIHSLTSWGLPPIAFEAPHYTMSSNGYHIASNYFTALFGQIQTSDHDWQVMISPLYISNPTRLNGMTLYPETIGFVDPNESDPIGKIKDTLDQVREVPGAVIGGFYHPYLGMDDLKSFVSLLEQVPNLYWIEIDNYEHDVQTEHVQISMPGNGEVLVDHQLSKKKELKNYVKENPFEVVLWGIVLITSIFVLIFTIYIVIFKKHYRKRLFMERL